MGLFGGSGRSQRLMTMYMVQKMEEQKAEMNRIAEEQRQAARNQERTRQANITEGISGIDNAFRQFNSKYFKNMRNKYIAAQNPEVDRQSADARDKLIAYLAGAGMSGSAVGAERFGELERKTQDARADIAGRAVDYVNDFKGKLNESKTNLYKMAEGSTRPRGIAARAVGEATSLARSGISGVGAAPGGGFGDIFGAMIEPLAYSLTASMNSPRAVRGGVTASNPYGGAYGSSSVIG